MKQRHGLSLFALTAGLALSLAFAAGASAQGKKSDSVVKATAKAGKAGKDGKQEVTITLEIDPKYHIYANPVGQIDFEDNQTSVSFATKGKLSSVKVEYPDGTLKKDKVIGDYKIYKGKVQIKAVVQRSGDAPLDAVIKIQACSDSACLLPAKIVVPVK